MEPVVAQRKAVVTPPRELVPKVDVDAIDRLAIALHFVTKPFVSEWHSHTKSQLLYAEGGVMHFQTRNSSYLLPAHHGAWIPPNLEHRVFSQSPGLQLRMIYFQESDPDEVILQNMRVFPVNNLAREMIYHTRIWNNNTAEIGVIEESFFRSIRLLIASWASSAIPLNLPTSEHAKLQPVLSYIREHLNDNLQIDLVASQFATSNRTLMRLFQNELGTSFSTYLRVARVIQALDLLSKPGVNVSQVAFDVGYESLSAFSNTFRQLVGMRPNQYLKLAETGDI